MNFIGIPTIHQNDWFHAKWSKYFEDSREEIPEIADLPGAKISFQEIKSTLLFLRALEKLVKETRTIILVTVDHNPVDIITTPSFLAGYKFHHFVLETSATISASYQVPTPHNVQRFKVKFSFLTGESTIEVNLSSQLSKVLLNVVQVHQVIWRLCSRELIPVENHFILKNKMPTRDFTHLIEYSEAGFASVIQHPIDFNLYYRHLDKDVSKPQESHELMTALNIDLDDNVSLISYVLKKFPYTYCLDTWSKLEDRLENPYKPISKRTKIPEGLVRNIDRQAILQLVSDFRPDVVDRTLFKSPYKQSTMIVSYQPKWIYGPAKPYLIPMTPPLRYLDRDWIDKGLQIFNSMLSDIQTQLVHRQYDRVDVLRCLCYCQRKIPTVYVKHLRDLSHSAKVYEIVDESETKLAGPCDHVLTSNWHIIAWN
jgi:hypothetical protein